MKLAIIGDIHGNIRALDAVLLDIERQKVDQIIVNGDMVNRGPNNVAVVERIRELDLVVTLGNHEDFVVKWHDRDPSLPQEWFSDPFWSATAVAARQLAEAGLIDSLRNLPMSHGVQLNSSPKLLISHGSPRHYREGFGRLLRDETAAEIVEEFPADVYIGSHIHATLEKWYQTYLFLNTGAVGTPFNHDPRAQYLILDLNGNGWRYTFRAVEYDVAGALAAFEETGYLQAGGLSAEIFRDELYYSRVLFDPYWRWLKTLNLKSVPETWASYKKLNPDRFERNWQTAMNCRH